MTALLVTAYTLDSARNAADENATEADPWIVTQRGAGQYNAYPATSASWLLVDGLDIIRYRTDQPALI